MGFRDKMRPVNQMGHASSKHLKRGRPAAGRPCDYTGLSYEKLSRRDGISWPCNEAHPEGEHWPYKEFVFPTDADYCETFGHDLITGGLVSPESIALTTRGAGQI